MKHTNREIRFIRMIEFLLNFPNRGPAWVLIILPVEAPRLTILPRTIVNRRRGAKTYPVPLKAIVMMRFTRSFPRIDGLARLTRDSILHNQTRRSLGHSQPHSRSRSFPPTAGRSISRTCRGPHRRQTANPKNHSKRILAPQEAPGSSRGQLSRFGQRLDQPACRRKQKKRRRLLLIQMEMVMSPPRALMRMWRQWTSMTTCLPDQRMDLQTLTRHHNHHLRKETVYLGRGQRRL